MIRRIGILLLVLVLPCTTACQHLTQQPGPGMIVTYSSLKNGVGIYIKSARLPSGQAFPHAGSVGGRGWPFPNGNPWWNTGKTMGAAPDGRQLPEWVEFEWIESVYPEDPAQSLEQFRALPHHTQRVLVRDRIPKEVVDEVIASKLRAPPNRLPDRSLWVYFAWTNEGIKMRWSLESYTKNENTRYGGTTRLLRSGGDTVVAGEDR